VIYLLVFDFIGYWVHRAQHQWDWWWRLHAVHHSQRQMTMWSDNRNHLLDSALNDAIFVAVAIAIGVAPSQFVGLVAVTQLFESLQHANLRCSFGRVAERLLVSPRFHRRHHAIGVGHEARSAREPSAAGPPKARAPPGGSEPRAAGSVGANIRGVNFGVLFSCWDALLGSADWAGGREPTGIRDQVEQGATTGAASGRSSGWGSSAWPGGMESPDEPAVRLVLACRGVLPASARDRAVAAAAGHHGGRQRGAGLLLLGPGRGGGGGLARQLHPVVAAVGLAGAPGRGRRAPAWRRCCWCWA
jgi:hypothetical protein